MLYVTSNFGGIFAINTATNVVVRTINAPGWLEDIAVAPDGTELYVANENSGIDIYNVASGLRVASIPIAGGAFGLAVTPSGSQLIVTSSRGSSVTLITRTTRVVTQVFSVFGVPRRIAFASGGAIIVISDESGKLHLLK